MGFKFCGSQLVAQLDAYIADQFATVDVHLFVNNVTPTEAFTLGDLNEATFSGYAAKTGVVFGAAALVSTKAVSSAPQQLWTVSATSGADVAYGYYLTKPGSGAYIGAEAFAGGGITMSMIGQLLALYPQLTHGDE